jgi:hypothetical protein
VTGISRGVEAEAGKFGDAGEMGVECVEAVVVVEGGGHDVEPGNGESVVAELPRQGDGPVPVGFGAGAVGDDGEKNAA